MDRVLLQSAAVVLAATTVFAVGGCAPRTTRVHAASAAPVAARRIVYFVDVTGSYTFPRQAFDQAAREVEQNARPGDTWFFRIINNESYNERSAIFTLRCPAPVVERVNPFDSRSRARAAARERSFAALKAAAARQLRQYHHAPVIGTDIYGALAKAGELFADAAPGTRKVLVMATDFGDTRRRRAAISLHGVEVIVGLFEGGSRPAFAQRMKKTWAARLRHYGATRITFLDPSEGLTSSLLER